MVQRYEQTRKLQWYKRGAAYAILHDIQALGRSRKSFIQNEQIPN